MGTLEQLAAQLLLGEQGQEEENSNIFEMGANTQRTPNINISSLEKLVAQENPYYMINSGTSAAMNAAQEYLKPLGIDEDSGRYVVRDTYSEALPWALGAGVLQGVLSGFGDDYQGTLQDRYLQALSGQEPSGYLPGKLFSNAKTQAQLFGAQQRQQQGQLELKEKKARLTKLQDKLLENGVTLDTDEEGNMWFKKIPALDPIAKESALIGAKKTAELAAEDDFWRRQSQGGIETLNPNSPKAKAIASGEEKLTALRKELQGAQAFQDYQVAEKGYRVMLKAAKDPSAASDLDFVYGAIQMIEPGMAVREGEQAAVANSTSIPDAFKGYMQKALTGQGALTTEVREGILRLAARRFDEHARTFGSARTFYEQEAQRLGAPNPAAVTYMENPPSADEVARSLSGNASMGAGTGGGGDIRSKAAAILAARKQLSQSQPPLTLAPTPLR